MIDLSLLLSIYLAIPRSLYPEHRSLIGPENSRQLPSQSYAKLKLNQSRLCHPRFPTLEAIYESSLSVHLLFLLFFFVCSEWTLMMAKKTGLRPMKNTYS